MDRKELFSLKLRMGISPAVEIDPQLLRTMWRQLCAERRYARRHRNSAGPLKDPATSLKH